MKIQECFGKIKLTSFLNLENTKKHFHTIIKQSNSIILKVYFFRIELDALKKWAIINKHSKMLDKQSS